MDNLGGLGMRRLTDTESWGSFICFKGFKILERQVRGTDAVKPVKYDWLDYYWQENLIKYSMVKYLLYYVI